MQVSLPQHPGFTCNRTDCRVTRKCGRVVCASCSPHRITIPYQYIVHPPGTPRPGAQRHSSSFLSSEVGYADFSSLGGGEKVRLCNPCVPDPNTNPPQSQESPGSRRVHSRSQSGASGTTAHGSTLASPGRPTYFATRADDPYGRNRSVTMVCAITESRVIRANSSNLVGRRLSTSLGQSALPISVHSKQNFERDPSHPLSLRRALIELFLPGV